GYSLPLTFRDRAKDHRHGLVGAALLRVEAEPARHPAVLPSAGPNRRADGTPQWRGLTPAASGARSTPANPPKRGWSRNSIRSPLSAKPARPSSAASATRAG